MIKDDSFFFTACDQCGEHGPPEEDRSEAEREARRQGWTVEDGKHVCDNCLAERAHRACVAAGGHTLTHRTTYENGTELWWCGSCGYHEFTQPTLKDGAS